MTLPPVLRAVHVRRTPDDAFALFTERIGAWWPLLTHGLFGDRSGGVAFDDGRLVERSLDGEETVWGEITAWEPGHRLAFTWHPGTDTGAPSAVEVHFSGDADGTRLELSHAGWESFGARALAARRSYAGPNAWGWVLEHYADTVERAVDADADRPDTAALRQAYETFFAEALAGGFGRPADDGWSALQVLAHVVANDDALAAVCRALLAERDPKLDNAVVTDVKQLDAIVGAHGDDVGALVATGRRRADEVCLLVERLDESGLAAPVATHLVDAGQVVVDGELPWSALILGAQVRRHLPGHTEQLRALRPAG